MYHHVYTLCLIVHRVLALDASLHRCNFEVADHTVHITSGGVDTNRIDSSLKSSALRRRQ